MAELPEIVRQRLARQAGGEHPDPDLLTAFAEGTLGERERAQVFGHLGACAACREVVSLALPEVPAPQPAPAPAVSGWLRWPVLRWGAVAAAVVIVAAAVMLRETRRTPLMDGGTTASLTKHDERVAAKPQAQDQETRAEAKQNTAAAPKGSAGEKLKTSAPAMVGRSDKDFKENELRKEEALAVAKKAAPAAKLDVAVDALQQQRAVASQGPSQVITQQQRDQQSVPAGQQAYVAGTVGGNVQQQSQWSVAQQAAPALRAPAPSAAAPAGAAQNIVVTDRAEVAAPPMAEAAAPKSEVAMMKSKPARKLPGARWRISSDGKLERSVDAGASWRVLPVQDGTSFRAVSASGGDIWVGGAAGALYHSADGGQSWARIVPRADELTLTADIARVEFTDSLHGFVTTATGETWATSDGGRSWSVRR